ncbi:hypothetical protein [Sinisalibacter aestuarii]|uniref:Uncharacterized protein n=1 Tax=Sinisalibacter aestuarii TaxID=2949426 RepID=A0ABQ5LPW8_9RHOB|nr:hypothetical protein [Sinisalibacter aestuarii]GKY86964.1 hypothetical protein STA1M1_08330 [Sinisalibacter aestuarii]
MEPGERAALKLLSGLLAEAHQPWWLIGPAAVALLGGEAGSYTRFEVIVSPGDARRLAEARGLDLARGPATALQRARKSLSLPLGGIEARLMVWAEQHLGGRWVPMQPKTRVAIDLGDGRQVFTPDRAELISLLKRTGRARDLARAASLEGAP